MNSLMYYRAVVEHPTYEADVSCVRLTNRRFLDEDDARAVLGKDFLRLYEEDPLVLLVDDNGEPI